MVHGELCRESSGRLYAWEAVTLRDSYLRCLATHYHLLVVNRIFEGREAWSLLISKRLHFKSTAFLSETSLTWEYKEKVHRMAGGEEV